MSSSTVQVNNGTTVRQRIMNHLNTTQFPVRKNQIIDAVDSTDFTVVKELAFLGRQKLIYETKGYYAITPKGRELLKEDPQLSSLTSKFTPSKTKANAYEELPIDWEFVKQDAICCHILRGKVNSPTEILLPFVILYLKMKNYPLPAPNKKPEDQWYSEKLSKAMETYFATLAEELKD